MYNATKTNGLYYDIHRCYRVLSMELFALVTETDDNPTSYAGKSQRKI